MSNELKASLGYKGERGYSAYEIAVQNGFVGTEADWLASLGTANHFTKTITVYTTTEENETTFDIPNGYVKGSFLDVYINGEWLDETEYTIDTTNAKIVLTNAIDVVGTKVQVVLLTMSVIYFDDKFKILTGTISANSNTTVDYPLGFTYENCVAIALKADNKQNNSLSVVFEEDSISLTHEDTSATEDITYTMVLMRID